MDAGIDDTVLGKVHLLLSAFSLGRATLGLAELARRSGVPKATTYRLAERLVGLGYLLKTSHGYQLGWRLYELGQIVPGPARLRALARPTLVDLRMAVQALVVHLAVPRGEEVVYVDRIGGRRESSLLAAVGASAPAEHTLSGRLLQAYRSSVPGELIPEELRRDRQLIRDRRWGAEYGSIVPDMKSFAVPIEYPSGSQVIASLSATVHIGRDDDARVLRALWAAGAEITRALQRGPVH